jgi:hypothetical protein
MMKVKLRLTGVCHEQVSTVALAVIVGGPETESFAFPVPLMHLGARQRVFQSVLARAAIVITIKPRGAITLKI